MVCLFQSKTVSLLTRVSCDRHEDAEVLRGEGHQGGREDGEAGEEQPPECGGQRGHPGRGLAQDGVQVVPQRDGDDREVGGEREHREQGEEVVRDGRGQAAVII